MKVSFFTHMTKPEERMDPWKEALDCYSHFADEVVVVGENWPYEFNWKEIGQNFQEGFDKSTGDWVVNMPLDMFLHENSKEKLLNSFKQYDDEPALALPKFKFFSPNRCEFKNFEILFLNKKKFPDIKLNGGGDLCLATLDGMLLDYTNIPIVNIPIWNYDTTFRTKKVIAEDRARFARAWYRYFNEWSDRGGGEEKEAYDAWFKMIKSRLPRHITKVQLHQHPYFIQSTLNSLSEDQFGYNCFGLLENSNPNAKIYYEHFKTKLKFPDIKLIT
jgi:hypothetical protein